ncbi:MAG: glycosyltransferase [Sporomusaceae bacterium]|nr:glycosyltransferase [Sporomusaceae bacterium]
MKILFVTPRFPFPPYKGDQILAFRRMQTLCQFHDIVLITFYESDSDLDGLAQLSEYCSEIYTVKLTKSQALRNILCHSPFSALPFQVLYYESKQFRTILKKVLAKTNFDVIHTFLLRMAEYTKEIPCPKVIELIDSMQLNFERRIEAESGIKRIIFKNELNRLRKYERNLGTHFDHMILSAQKDKEYFTDNNISVIQSCVPLDEFVPVLKMRKSFQIVFSGNMDYFPNIHAMKWFVATCFPAVKMRYPEATLVIAGKNPTKDVQRLASINGVVITGFVKSMSACLNQASIAIAPMQSGSGIQTKILEAMACGLPVVTTSLGKGSIVAEPGRELLVADSAEDFFKEIDRLFRDSCLAEEIGNNARKYVERNHNWYNTVHSVNDIYCRIQKGDHDDN